MPRLEGVREEAGENPARSRHCDRTEEPGSQELDPRLIDRTRAWTPEEGHRRMGARFPFSAAVGHDDLRTALLLSAVHPGIGGVLVRGEKGTAKSTVVRALAALLPELDVSKNCRFGCAPGSTDCPDAPHDG